MDHSVHHSCLVCFGIAGRGLFGGGPGHGGNVDDRSLGEDIVLIEPFHPWSASLAVILFIKRPIYTIF
jgi:hypothetical protein